MGADAARPGRGFRGNKRGLPSKPCAACGRPMTWRKRWARCWDNVRYCSGACRAGVSEAARARRPGAIP